MPRKKQAPPAGCPPTSSYVGEIGFLRVSASIPGESPIWCPVKVLSARYCYQRVDFVVEPIGGFGSMKASSKLVWFGDQVLNRMTENPCKVM